MNKQLNLHWLASPPLQFGGGPGDIFSFEVIDSNKLTLGASGIYEIEYIDNFKNYNDGSSKR